MIKKKHINYVYLFWKPCLNDIHKRFQNLGVSTTGFGGWACFYFFEIYVVVVSSVFWNISKTGLWFQIFYFTYPLHGYLKFRKKFRINHGIPVTVTKNFKNLINQKFEQFEYFILDGKFSFFLSRFWLYFFIHDI